MSRARHIRRGSRANETVKNKTPKKRTNKSYQSTAKGLFQWANSELEHVGRIAGVKDIDLQYTYAMSTLNGMAHLKDAIYQYIMSNEPGHLKTDLKIVHDKVIRVMKHLVKTYKLDIQTIVNFNTRHTLSNLIYLDNKDANNKGSRRKNTVKSTRSMRGGMCSCMLGRRGGQRGGDGQETTDYTVQGIPTTDDDNSVIVIGTYGPVTAKDYRQVMEDKEAGRLD